MVEIATVTGAVKMHRFPRNDNYFLFGRLWRKFNMEANFERIYPLILQENLSGALDLLKSMPDDQLSGEQLALKGRFLARFETQSEVWADKTNEPVAKQIAAAFRDYWNVVLLDGEQLEVENLELENKIIDLLIENGYVESRIPRDLIFQDLYLHVNEFLKSKGYYANAMGRTGSFYDLFLWTEQTEHEYAISLPETETTVKVVFMDGFISNGWAHYATFGKNYAAGWARAEALYCVKSAYDIESEYFQISYLSHEAQHFVDYQSFPMLEQTDLEYRAKLAELSLADEIAHDLLGKFTARAKDDRRYAHPFANYSVIGDLSQAVFGQDFVGEGGRWAEISAERINEASKALLFQHTANLKESGAERVRGFI